MSSSRSLNGCDEFGPDGCCRIASKLESRPNCSWKWETIGFHFSEALQQLNPILLCTLVTLKGRGGAGSHEYEGSACTVTIHHCTHKVLTPDTATVHAFLPFNLLRVSRFSRISGCIKQSIKRSILHHHRLAPFTAERASHHHSILHGQSALHQHTNMHRYATYVGMYVILQSLHYNTDNACSSQSMMCYRQTLWGSE